MRESKTWRVSSWILILCFWTTGWQPGGQVALAQEPASDDLKIVIIAGDGFTNNIKKRTARESIVEVRDRNNKPVSGAAVSFLLPNGGPSGTFANGARTLSLTTNQTGRAAVVIKPNSVPGAFKTNVTASFQGQTAVATIAQTNALLAAGISGTAIGIAVGVAAAAAVTAVAVVKAVGGGKSAKISVGAPSLP